MFNRVLSAQGMQLVSKAAHALRVSDWTPSQIEPEGLRNVTSIAVAGHWFVIAVCLVELVYRPYYGLPRFAVYALLLLALIGLNGYIHYRLRTNRPIAWHWLMAICTLDLVLISAGTAISNGFSHPFFHLFYYPALAAFASMFSSFRLNMVLVTLVAVIYTVISLTAGDGLDMGSRDEKDLLARIAVMYLVVMVVNFATNFERLRWRQARERERALEQERVALAQALQRERIELSQNIHDTAAQSAYMIGLGIDTARELAGEEMPELTATLEATSRLSRSTIWELRHPINMGSIYEGRELGRALRSHATSFTNITTVPAEMEQTGVEPPPFHRDQERAVLDSAQRADQRLPARGGDQGMHWPGLQPRKYQPVGVGRRGWAAGGLRGAGARLQEHEHRRGAPGRVSCRGRTGHAGRRQRNLRDTVGVIIE